MNDNLARAYDALLIIQYQAGSDEAIEELISRYARSVRRRVVHRIGGECAAVDDITQEVWIQVIKSLPKLNSPITWQAWLFQIVSRQVALFFRRRERPVVPIEAVLEFASLEGSKTSDDFNIDEHVGSLVEPYQSIIRLRYWKSMSYQAIAESLSIPIGTVRSRLHEARKRLTTKLNNQGERNEYPTT